MGKKKWEVEFYEKENGRCPTEDFLDGLRNPTIKARIKRAIARLEEHGRDLDRPHVGYLRDHISELRIITHQGNFRILFFSSTDISLY